LEKAAIVTGKAYYEKRCIFTPLKDFFTNKSTVQNPRILRFFKKKSLLTKFAFI